MLPLRDLQRAFADALTSGDARALLGLIGSGSISAADRFDVYAANREVALINALRLTYPAVEALVGDAFFASVARDFVRDLPPTSALLTLYGESFAAFLEADARTALLPYLADVARLEWAVSQVSQRANRASEERFPVGTVSMAFRASLTLLHLRYAAAAIWRAALEADEAAFSRISLDPRPVTVAVWRAGAGANAVALSAAAATFVDGLMTHGDVAVAVTDAAAYVADPIAVIRDEVLQADFVHLEPLAA